MTSGESPYPFLSAPASPTRGNVTVYVTDTLRSAIVTLALKPGEVVDKGAICERLGVSRFPVSEALARLQAEGLVDILPQRGSTVSLVRIADVLEYMLIRKALEAEAIRVLIARRPAGLVEELERNLRLTDSVIRYYSVKIAENVDPAARTSEFTEEAFTKAATPGPDEEEIATGQANVRSPFDEEEGAFDFEEAVFGGVDEPRRGGKKD